MAKNKPAGKQGVRKKPQHRSRSGLTKRRGTAIHEAGHAVIARVLTLACGYATIKPDYDVGTAGHTINADPNHTTWQWERRGKVRNTEAVWHARIISYMAGATAQKELTKTAAGDGDDRYQIELMALELPRSTDWAKLELRLRAMTRMLVRRHRKKIELVADALLAKKTLTSKQLDKLVGRSIDDVKVNAPFLLNMHRRFGAGSRVRKSQQTARGALLDSK